MKSATTSYKQSNLPSSSNLAAFGAQMGKGEAKSRGWVGRGWVGGSWIVGRGSCLFEDIILAPSVFGPNLQLSAHEFISPNSF